MRMQLDGPDLEELLVRARDEYGDGVRIVKADRVRTGGIGGFFSKERYELTIESDGESLPDDESLPEGESAPGGDSAGSDEPFSLLDLAELVSERERQSRPTTSVQVLEPAPRPAPRVSTESDSFADILAGLTDATAPEAGGRTTVTVPETPAAERHAPEARPTFVPARRETAERAPAKATRSAKTVRPVARQAGARTITARTLRDLGVPAALLRASRDDDLLATLVAALRALPTAPALPHRAGELLVVAGEATVAWEAARQLAAAIQVEERVITLVSRSNPVRVPASRRVATVDDLPTHIERWRRRATPSIAVLDAPLNPRTSAWCRAALDQLAAAAATTWLVVPATRKTPDIGEWSRRLGHGDALVVTDVDASRDPASVLGLGLPVGWLDGRPATAGAWAGLLVERLVEAA